MFGGSYDFKFGKAKHDYRDERFSKDLPPSRDAKYLDGRTMMIRSKALERVGLFDEKLFLYGEDTDLRRRIQLAGYRTVVVRDAKVLHYHGEYGRSNIPPHQVFYETRDHYYLVRKYGDLEILFGLICDSWAKCQYASCGTGKMGISK